MIAGNSSDFPAAFDETLSQVGEETGAYDVIRMKVMIQENGVRPIRAAADERALVMDVLTLSTFAACSDALKSPVRIANSLGF
jgi:hypothetical protein